MNFDSHYDAPVRLAALLVNALTPGEERGRPLLAPTGADRRVAATEAVRSIDPAATLSAVAADRLAGYAARLRAAFAADLDTAVGVVDRLLADTRTRPAMARHDEQLWHLHYAGTTGGEAGRWAGTCAAALGIVLGGEARHRLGVCTAPHCDRVFVDTSHNGTRRFCSTPCQNRVKTAAFRARHNP